MNRNQGRLSTPDVQPALIHDLAVGAEWQQDLARRYNVCPQSVSKFRQRHRLRIEALSRRLRADAWEAWDWMVEHGEAKRFRELCGEVEWLAMFTPAHLEYAVVELRRLADRLRVDQQESETP